MNPEQQGVEEAWMPFVMLSTEEVSKTRISGEYST